MKSDIMKNKIVVLIAVFCFAIGLKAIAQETAATPPPATSISKGLGLYIFPSADQTQEQLDADEMECYKWAKTQTNYDPLNPTKVDAAAANTDLNGSAVVGAAKGAAAGAAIGAISGDAGQGAAIGAVVGGLAGRRARKAGDQAEQQQNNAAAAETNKKMLDDYIKAFSACMEGKKYTVK
jgi:OmpA family protein